MSKGEYFKNKCPFCEGSNLEYGSIEPEDEIIKQPVDCKDCGKEFEIITVPEWYIRIKK